MIKKANKKRIVNNWIMLISSFLIGLILILVTMAISDYRHTTLSSEKFSDYVKNEKMKDVKKEVEHRIDEIKYDFNNIQTSKNLLISQKIREKANLLLSSNVSNTSNLNNKKIAIVKEFERIISSDNEYLYYILDTNGTLLRSGTDNKLNGQNILNSQDKDGVYFTREMLKAINYSDGIFTTYYWPKIKNGEPLQKTSFSLYIKEFDIIIGTGNYHEDIINELKRKIYSRLIEYYKYSDRYIFINTFDGISLVHNNPEFIGTDLNFILDYNGNSVIKSMMKKITSDKKGFVSYPYKEPNSDIISEKTSYVETLGDEWGAFIGMGYHTNDLILELNKYKYFFQNEHFKELVISIILFIILAFIMFIFTKRGISLQLQYTRQEELIFENLFKLSPEGIIIATNSGNIIFKNEIAKKIINTDLESKIGPYGTLKFEKVETDIFKLVTKNDRTYYINFRSNETIYHKIDSHIFFLRDVTDEYLKSNELTRMALYDQLTTLPNRRKLLNDLEDLCSNKVKIKNLAIALIDLDNFKDINDKYGHDVGDEVLKTLSNTFTSRLRNGDFIYRYGGEEFIVILKNITKEKSIEVLNEINTTFNNNCNISFNFPLTFSGGLTLCANKENIQCNFDLIFKEIDVLLYKAKKAGRNNIKY